VDKYLSELQSPGGPPKRHWRYASAFAIAFLLLTAIAGYGVVQNQRAVAARTFVSRTLAIQDTILQLQTLSILMESHQRGFLVTGNTHAIDLRDRAHAEGQRTAQRLLALVAGDAELTRRANGIAMALQRRYERMLEVGGIAIHQGLDAGRGAFAIRGEGSADPVLGALSTMRGEQRHRLAMTSARADREASRFRLVQLYGTTFALLLVLLTSVLMLRQLARNARLGRQLAIAHRLQEQKGQELERSNRELEAFSYTISHDLRAPLRHVDGYARMLQEDAAEQLTPDMRRYLDTISESSRHMGALIDDLLAYSRLGRKPLEQLDVDMNALVERALPEAGTADSCSEVKIGVLPRSYADPVLMRQVWVNLLSNAIKYSAPKGTDAKIEVTGERDGNISRYAIRDNGVGFDMRYADKLFGVFQRLHAQEDFEGTGVGLAIVKQIVERHGGRVAAASVPGQGACFTIEIPAVGNNQGER
jgi:signal transduction histidine kinase